MGGADERPKEVERGTSPVGLRQLKKVGGRVTH